MKNIHSGTTSRILAVFCLSCTQFLPVQTAEANAEQWQADPDSLIAIADTDKTAPKTSGTAISSKDTSAKKVIPYPNIDLSNVKPDKRTVLGGSVLTSPIRTESGHLACIEGKIIYSFDMEGKPAWYHGISSKPELLSTGRGGMIYAVSRKTQLSMINPSGTEIWKKNVGFNIIESPFAGRDGRVIVRGENEIACYGLRGVRRWKIDIPGQDASMPLVELNDGRIIVFLAKTVEGKTTITTLSPFGERMEDITFAGLVKSASQCTQGVLLSFADGSIGLCAVQNGKTVSKWIKFSSDTKLSSGAKIIPDIFETNKSAFVSFSQSKIILVNNLNGEVEKEISTGVNAENLLYSEITAQGLVLADRNRAECYDKELNPVWKASYSGVSNWEHLFITDTGFIVFCGKDWVISSYCIKQTFGLSAPYYRERKLSQYYSLYSGTASVSSPQLGRAIGSETEKKMLNDWKNGDFDTREQNYMSVLNNEMTAMNSAFSVNAINLVEDSSLFFTNNVEYCQTVLNLVAKSQLCTFTSYMASFMKNPKAAALTYYLVKDAQELGFDPDGEMLNALEYVVRHAKPGKEDYILMAVCDATYEICKFMGKPAFFKKGNEILSYMFYPQYSLKVRMYAKKTLDKLIKLGL